jgi:RNA polymerase sigma factor for flagellar operon FliA
VAPALEHGRCVMVSVDRGLGSTGVRLRAVEATAGHSERTVQMGKRREETKGLWRRFKDTGDQETRNQLVEIYMPLVKYTAERLKGKLPQCVDIQEMISAGMLGLIHAVDKFDPDRGIQFETYCSMRIRGSILDDLRASDWVPRLIRNKANRLGKAKLELAFELGREPRDEEIARRMGLSTDEYEALLREVEVRAQLPIEGAYSDDTDDHDVQRVDLIEDRSQTQPLETLSIQEVREVATKGLSDKERRVVAMYYFDGLTMKEIGAILNISESRVCQIHSQVLKLLRERYKKQAA